MKAGRASKSAPASKPRKIDATDERRESSSQSPDPTQPTGSQLERHPLANLLPLRAKAAGVGCPVHEYTGTDYGIRIIARANSGRSDPLDRSPAPTRKSGPPVRSKALQRHFSIEAVAEALDVLAHSEALDRARAGFPEYFQRIAAYVAGVVRAAVLTPSAQLPSCSSIDVRK